jgi:mono/diheme cytochrome c family protein
MLSRAFLSLAIPAWSALLFLPAVSALAAEQPWMAPAAEREQQNPIARAAGLPEGKKLFETNCSVCHGPTGRGDGPAAAALTPKPTNLTSKEVQAQTDGALFWKISTGRGGMPSWQTLPEKDRWSVVDFIRSLGGS